MNTKKITILLLMVLVLFSALSFASASDNTDNMTLSVADGENTINVVDEDDSLAIDSGTFTQLSEKIQNSGSGTTVVLDRNYTHADGDSIDGIVISKDLTIDGAGYTLDGAGQASIFRISGNSNVVLKNLNFINAYGTNGPAVSLSAGDSVDISDSKFINNVASASGGAIYISSSSNITANSKITNSVFINNKAFSGGAISARGTLLDVTHSQFKNNTASGSAGSIFLDVGAYFDNCEFIDSHADGDGGAIYLQSIIKDFSALPSGFSKNYGIYNSRFVSCSAGNDGGAGYIYVNHGLLVNSTFINNTANQNGGSLVWGGVNGIFSGCDFINSTASRGDGGALYQKPSDDVSVFDGITIINETNFVHNAARFNGGAVYVSGIFAIIHNSQFSEDKARDGAGIYLDVGASIEYCSFVGESALNNGGAVYLSASNINTTGIEQRWIDLLKDNMGIRHSTFINCSAAFDGGAGYVAGDGGFVTDSTFIRNNAGHDGGAAYVAGDGGNLSNSTFISNRAARDGGAIMWAGDNGSVDNTEYIRNHADGGSGSICVRGSNISIFNSTFRLSNATLNGGAIYVYGNDVNITDSLFDNCLAIAYHGGAIFIEGKNTHIVGCNFTTNRVNVGVGRGGAINIIGNDTLISDCEFDHCTASEGGFVLIAGNNVKINNVTGLHSFAAHGGAFYIRGNNASITNAFCEYNNATQSAGAIYVEGSYATIINITLAKNIAYNSDGGAIYIAGLNTTIINANLTQNKVTGPAAHGGAIYLKGNNAKIFNSTFDMCTAYNGGVLYISGLNALIDGYSCTRSLALNDGGAIYVEGDYATIADFDISRSNATNCGGAIYVSGSYLNVRDSNFTDCISYDGGAIYVYGQNTNISGTIFKHVMAEQRGGAVHIRLGEHTNIENSNFTFCNSTYGGAVDIEGNHVMISGSNMIDCYSMEDGGAVYVAGNNVSMVDSNFTRCLAENDNGGAVYWIGSIGLVNGSNFINNTAPKLGGAIFMKENSKITIDSSYFINNTAGINGGAIDFNRGANDEIILNSVFENNMANRSAGAIYWFGMNGTIKNSNFTNNRALGIVNYTDSYGNVTYGGYGGAVMWTGAQGIVDNSIFINNYAQYNEATKSGGRGGAVYLQGSDVGNGHDTVFSNSLFINNTAGYNGGAITWFRGAANGRVENSTFINNTAHRSGGGIHWSGVNGTITDSTFFNNSALGNITDENGGGDGGAVLWVGPEGRIQTVNFTNNRAAYSGGAIFLKGSDNGTAENCTNVLIKDGIFVDNTAGLNGGAVTFQKGAINGTLSNSTFINNTASRNGGAVFWYGYNGTISKSKFMENEALGLVDVDARGVHQYIDENGNPVLGGCGGAVAWIGEVGHVNDSDFINNTATRFGGAIFLRDNGYTTFIGDNFTDNFAGVNGGAVNFNRGAHDGAIINSTFENNIANRSGGGVYWFGTEGTIKGSNFTNNSALGLVEYKDSYGNLTYGGYGGAVMWTGSQGLVDDCRFEDNYAQYNEATKSGGRGGAVYLQGSDEGLCMNTTFSNSVFINNTAGYNGGAVAWFRGARNGHVENSTFINNTAQRSGGAISWTGINGTVNNATFTNNVALGNLTDANGGGEGGAILWVGREGHLNLVDFYNNTAAYSGGAIFLKGSDDGLANNCTNVSISNGLFEDNFAGLNGGAITFQRGAMNGTLSSSTFINNTASRNGGALFWFGHNGTVNNCSFIENEALGLVDTDARGLREYIDANGTPVLGGSGGAIAWIGELGHVNDSEFINNTAARLGGAVFLRDNGYTTFANDKFINNTAGVNGGAVDFNRGAHHGSIINSTFENNLANRSGGAVLWFGTTGTIRDSNFTNNTAMGLVEYKDSYGNLTYGGYGGAIMWTGANGIVDNCQFDENSAARRGGAVYLQGSYEGNCTNTTFNECVFTSNVAGTNGGAVDWHEGAHDGHIYKSTFENNIANSNGGAVYWRGHDGFIVDSNFTNNTALGDHPGYYGNVGDGGAMFWAGLNGLVENCRFIDNEAVNNPKYNASGRGGAVYIEPCSHGNKNTTFRNAYFENNTAGTNGGAINWHVDAEDGLVDNSLFVNNTAKRSGGAIFWNGYHGEIKYSGFYGNRALGIANATSVRGEITSGGDGGAVMWSGAEGHVDHCNFVNNTASKRGGAVLLQGNEDHPCLNTVFDYDYFENNHAGTNGGAIDWYRGARDGFVDNSVFLNNTAERAAGAIYWSGVNGTVKNSKFIQNSALGNVIDSNGGGDGGAILWVGQNGKIEDSNFSDNHAAFSGGAIFLKGNDDSFSGKCSNVTVTRGVFENNSAGLNGGAITFQRGAMDGKLFLSEFINNTAYRNGGAVFWFGTNGTIDNCVFVDNEALGLVDEDSRGFYQYYDSDGNKVLGGSGGAVAWTGDIGAITDSRFVNNTADRYGGAIFLRDNVDTIYDGSSFINNRAENGGAIYWKTDSAVNITDCILIGNIASKGSAIYLSHNIIEIINSTLIDNRADAVQLTLDVIRSDSNHTIEIIATFKGNDNLLNAIWNEGKIALTNVTYLGVNGIANTGSQRKAPVVLEDGVKPSDYDDIYQTQYEDYQNITFYIYDNENNLLTSASVRTNISGMAYFKYTSTGDKLYELVAHPSDNYYTGIENSTSKKIVNIEIPATDISYLENESFVITVSDKDNDTVPTGNVTVYLDGNEIGNFTLTDGKTVPIVLSESSAGTHNLTIKYSGNEEFFVKESSTTFKIMKIDSFIIPTVENYTYGQSGKIIIQVPQKENNTITIVLNNQTYEVKVNESGYVEFDIPELDFGVYNVDLIYPESGNYLKSVNSTTFEIYPIINVNVVKSANVTEAYISDLINFTITLSNDGQINVHDVAVSDEIPDDFVIVDYAKGGKVSGNAIVWEIDELQNGSRMDLWIVVSPKINGTFTNVANVSSAEAGLNESDPVNVTVKPVADLKITKVVNATEIYVGDQITYTITVHNLGPCDATDVKVSEKLSKSFRLISADAEYGYYDEDEGIWNIGNLNTFESATLTLTVKAISAGTVENIVSVKADEKDFNVSDNSFACENVSISQRDSPIVIDVKNITYGEAIIVTISGPKDSNGTLNVTICGETYNNLSFNDGDLVFEYTDLAGGDYDIDVTFSGNNEYMPNSTHVSFNVAKITPAITIEVVDILEGEIEVLNVTVNAPGTVNITVNGITVEIPLDESVVTTDVLQAGPSQKYDGKATWRLINLSKGTYDVLAVYNGNENYTSVNASDSFHVRAEIENAEVNVGDVSVGETAKIEVKYPGDATGNVTVTVNGKTYTKALQNGAAVFNIPGLKAGSYDVDISYSGDDKYLPKDVKESFEVSKLSPNMDVDVSKVKVGQNGKVTVTLPKDATGTVTLEINGKFYSAPVKDGKAVFTIPNLKFGDYNIAIHYSGDDKYDEEYQYDVISVDLPEDNPENEDYVVCEDFHKEGLAKYPTGNPVVVLLLAVLAIGLGRIRLKK